MAALIRDRPAGEAPYRAACEGIIDLPLEGRHRPLIDFEDTLAGALRERYQVPADDEVSPAVWARASIGALRTALITLIRDRPGGQPQPAAFADTVRACFAALAGGV